MEQPEVPVPRPSAALVDWQIDEAVRTEHLIAEGYQAASARYATYEAHASDYVQVLSLDDGMTTHRRRPVRDGRIWLEPGETAKVYTSEVLNLGEDIYAIVTGLGQLYACGLTIGSTYVDPGSKGAIYLAVTNISRRPVCIPVGSPIARIQFWRLGETPARQHPGHQARRRIELEVRSTPADHDRRAARYEVALVVQTCLVVGLLWYANPDAVDRLFRTAAGDNLPPFAHFIVPVLVGPLVFVLARRVWRLVRHPLLRATRRAAEPTRPDPDH